MSLNVAICGEYNSENYGDGVIGVSLRSLISECCPRSSISAFDLSKRSRIDDVGGKNGKVKKISVLKRLHRKAYTRLYLYAAAVNFLLISRCKYMDYYIRNLGSVDLLVLGGGQLMMDSRLSFPLKIYYLIKSAESRRVPVVVFSVGVGKDWSWLAKFYFEKIVSSVTVKKIYCRDRKSCERLKERFPEHSSKIYETVDVALFLTADSVSERARTCALGVISPNDVRRVWPSHHLANYHRANRFWSELYSVLKAKFDNVVLFTNGSSEDRRYLNNLVTMIKEDYCSENVEVFLPSSKYDLISFISGSKLVVAARMHANIIAFALNVPSVAIEWDDKINSFMEYVGRQDFCVNADWISTNLIYEIIDRPDLSVIKDLGSFRLKLIEDFKASICNSIPGSQRIFSESVL